MRDYLKLTEIEAILKLHDVDLELIMEDMNAEAQTCLCAAHSEDECVCGAWEDD